MEFIGLGVLGIIFAVWLSIRTDKLLEKEDKIAKQMIEEGNKRTQQMIEEGNKRTQQMIEEGRKETQQLIERMERNFQETLAKMDERTNIILSHIADLIASEGDKTRELIRRK